MTLPVERSRSRRPVTWLTLIGVLLLPAVIGGILVGALYKPTDRLENITAAIVNDDKAVELNGQLVPLGRQLTGGLVKGADDQPSNIDWVISNDEDAAAGLKDGTYTAVVTIPENFTAASLSTRPGETPEKATIGVQTAPNARVVDGAITGALASTASDVYGSTLSSQYLKNVFLGFTTLSDQLGTAASGAHQLADGASRAADGAGSLRDGLGQLSTGATGLSDGAAKLAAGAGPLASGADQLSSGAEALAGGTRSAAAGVTKLADGNAELAKQIGALAAQIPPSFAQNAQQLANAAPQISSALTDAAAALQKAADDCTGTPEQCAALRTASDNANAALPKAKQAVTQIGDLSAGASKLPAGFSALAEANQKLADGGYDAAKGITTIAGGTDGIAGGATKLADGARQFGTGASALASGAGQVASGASDAQTGAAQLADGVNQVATGTTSLADGLDAAVSKLPTYTDAQATNLADVVADPVSATGSSNSLFGVAAVPLLAMAVLWFGALASFVVFQAVSARALTSRRPSALVALRGFTPAAIVGAVQGLLVAGVVQVASDYDWGDWARFAMICIVAGVTFAAVNQALVALFGGAGRWVAAIVGALALATSIVSTVPPVLAAFATLLPTSPAYNAMLGALSAVGGVGAGAAGLVVWAVLALVVTTLVVVRRRTVSARTAVATAG
ncbi:YhgE/Pip domain-containing protein [Microbacterium sp. SORGH_AS_0421]|uniref:YhgE/Pip domain-containing protein n=1 Tax=Microbacterium sp. SORGH_AS_0421 TaxID=3041768 RepID=UPI00278C9A8E|nr:YhgE/Pip domain-containing protein [Microbacterium sp. SORGH_AS_0421]MDQ1175686.1 putative membrane protein [Microbacterium sp. SORGH_AS_0421]